MTSGGVQAIISSMTARPDISQVQENGCEALSSLVTVTTESMRANVESIVSMGGIHAIINAMMLHPESDRVQVEGCAVLCYIANNNDKNKCSILDQGGMVAIFQAMKKNYTSVRVLSHACEAIGILAYFNARIQSATGPAGVRVVLHAIRLHKEVAEVCMQGLFALTSLIHSLKELMFDMVLSEDGIGLLHEIMTIHFEDEVLQMQAVKFLLQLTRSNKMCQEIVAQDGHNMVYKSVLQHPIIMQTAAIVIRQIADNVVPT